MLSKQAANDADKIESTLNATTFRKTHRNQVQYYMYLFKL